MLQFCVAHVWYVLVTRRGACSTVKGGALWSNPTDDGGGATFKVFTHAFFKCWAYGVFSSVFIPVLFATTFRGYATQLET